MTSSPAPAPSPSAPALLRVVGVPGAVLMGLGSILGTGIFVSVGIAAGIAGPAVLLATALAALVATCNGLSSAQLAASHPVSGGTYAYGYRWLSPALGFTAGWMFLSAKSASAATAALGFAGYVSVLAGGIGDGARTGLAVSLVVGLTALVASGMRRSNLANAVIVSVTLAGLALFVAAGSGAVPEGGEALAGAVPAAADTRDLLHATALMFVAYTGYGRIATLGEEIHRPRRSIPIAIVATLLVSMLLYVAVTAVAVASAGAEGLAAATAAEAAPLEVVARGMGSPAVALAVAVAAVTAMVGVLLNLVLGLSRVALAMARRGDLPTGLAVVSPGGSPRRAVVLVGVVVTALAATGHVETTWSFSAFTVLVYYAITNLAALRLAPEERWVPRWVPAVGLTSCLGLAFWVERTVWLAGLVLIGIGLGWHAVARRHLSRRAARDGRVDPTG